MKKLVLIGFLFIVAGSALFAGGNQESAPQPAPQPAASGTGAEPDSGAAAFPPELIGTWIRCGAEPRCSKTAGLHGAGSVLRGELQKRQAALVKK